MLFGSSLEVRHTQRKIRVDGWVKLYREIRLWLSRMIQTLVAQQTNSKPSEGNDSLCMEIDCIAQLLSMASKPILTTCSSVPR